MVSIRSSAKQSVHDDGGCRSYGQMIVNSFSGQGLQDMVRLGQEVLRQPPGRPEGQQHGRCDFYHPLQAAATHVVRAPPGRGGHRQGPAAFSCGNFNGALLKRIPDTDQFKGPLPLGVIPPAGDADPVIQNAVGQNFLVRQRRNDVIAFDAVSSSHPCDVVQVQIRYRRSDGFTVFVDHRIMNQCDVQPAIR